MYIKKEKNNSDKLLGLLYQKFVKKEFGSIDDDRYLLFSHNLVTDIVFANFIGNDGMRYHISMKKNIGNKKIISSVEWINKENNHASESSEINEYLINLDNLESSDNNLFNKEVERLFELIINDINVYLND